MRIAHIINNLQGGGAEKLLSLLLPIFNTKEISADLIVLNNVDPAFEDICIREKINLIILSKASSPYSPFHIVRLRKHLDNYEIVHTHLFPAQYWAVFAWLLSARRARLITTEHSTSNSRMKHPWLKPLERFVYSKYTDIISVSEATNRTLTQWLNFKGNERFKLIQNGVDLGTVHRALPYVPQQISPMLSDIDRIIIMVARFDDAKDHRTVIKAMHKLPQKFKLILVGAGPLMNECKEFVYKNQLSERVIFLGFRRDVAELIKSSFVTVISSFWEGFGLVAIESMAAGVPVVASNVPGLREVVEGASILFRQGDEQSLVSEIRILDNDAGKRAHIIKMQIKRAEKYDIKVTAENYIKIYESNSP